MFIEPKRRRFHPLRRLRHIFRRKAQSPEPCNEVKSCDEIVEPPILDTSKSRSTSELIDEPYTTRGRYVRRMQDFLFFLSSIQKNIRSRHCINEEFKSITEVYTPIY